MMKTLDDISKENVPSLLNTIYDTGHKLSSDILISSET